MRKITITVMIRGGKGNEKRTKWLCSVLLVATIGLTGCGQKQKTESRAEKSDENHFVGEWIVEPEYAISKVGDENTLFVDGRGEKRQSLEL